MRAGLFVDLPKGPVLLNYDIDEARFTKPVYPGMTIQVRFTVKASSSRSFRKKVDQEKRDQNNVAKGIVKFSVDLFDETWASVAIATVLTMVKKLDQA